MRLINMRNWCYFTLLVCCIMMLPLQVIAAPAQFVTDEADLFSANERSELETQIENYCDAA